MEIAVLMGIVMPIVFAVGGVLGWLATRRQRLTDDRRPAWRDTSLDDWRRERDRELELERAAREQEEETPPGA